MALLQEKIFIRLVVSVIFLLDVLSRIQIKIKIPNHLLIKFSKEATISRKFRSHKRKTNKQ